jgi:hypothetical protein
VKSEDVVRALSIHKTLHSYHVIPSLKIVTNVSSLDYILHNDSCLEIVGFVHDGQDRQNAIDTSILGRRLVGQTGCRVQGATAFVRFQSLSRQVNGAENTKSLTILASLEGRGRHASFQFRLVGQPL